MNFASIQYLFFLIICVIIYYTISKSSRNLFLLFASYFFYSLFGFGFTLLMLITTLITYYCSYYSYYANDIKKRKQFFAIGLSLDLLIFILFKYIHIIDIDIMNWLNWSVQKLLVLIGISFYTFKTVGYCIDLYKRKYEPDSSLLSYALSVSFFPQLIAGPIEKSISISKQLNSNKIFNSSNAIYGTKLILWGLFKKIVIADSIALIINPVFSDIYSYKGLDLFVCCLGFAIQIYADFSGYSDIAIGSAAFFGVKLPPNFNKPYFSKNYREFWVRWHATFSKWLKEYVFDPLGGVVKNNQLKTLFNIFLLFLIVGFWHGATLNYMIYSQFAFLFIIIDIITKDIRKRFIKKIGLAPKSIILNTINYLAMVLMITFLVIYFRPQSFGESTYIIDNITSFHFHHLTIKKVLFIGLYILVLEIFQYFQINANGHCFEKINNFYLRACMYCIVLFSIILFGGRPEITFQYFQF
ncbi:MAG: MBOAT family protein [Bacteroidetes bacterium]|nr:MBOAT family protein [Bacteroidota bacterium]